MTREQIKVGIQIAARISELRRLAAETTEANDQGDSDLPKRHRELRRMLFAIAAARRGRKGAR
jgi:hypothetical protein